MNAVTKEHDWKRKIGRELVEYCIVAAYLILFFGVFAWYRRLILIEYQITGFDYWASFAEALALAHLIVMGGALHIGRRFENRPLIIPTLHKAVVFCLWVGFFGVLEHTVKGLLHGKGLMGGIHTLMNKGWDELLARCVVMFFAFIPFFAFKELGRVLGEGKIAELFFKIKGASQ